MLSAMPFQIPFVSRCPLYLLVPMIVGQEAGNGYGVPHSGLAGPPAFGLFKAPFDPTDKLDCGLQREIPHA